MKNKFTTCLLLFTGIGIAQAQSTLLMSGTVNNNGGVPIAVNVIIDPDSSSAQTMTIMTDSNGYYVDSATVMYATGALKASIIDCNQDTITLNRTYQGNPSGRYWVQMSFDYCPSASCQAMFTKSQAYTGPFGQPIPYSVQIIDQSQGSGLTYYWDFGDSSTYTGKSTVHTYSGTGPYYLCLTVSNTLCTDSFCDTVRVDSLGNVKSSSNLTLYVGDAVPAGIDKQKSSLGEVELFPNPAGNIIKLRLSSALFQRVQLGIYTAQGALMETASLNLGSGQSTHELDISGLKSGLYLLTVNAGESMKAMRFIKE